MNETATCYERKMLSANRNYLIFIKDIIHFLSIVIILKLNNEIYNDYVRKIDTNLSYIICIEKLLLSNSFPYANSSQSRSKL